MINIKVGRKWYFIMCLLVSVGCTRKASVLTSGDPIHDRMHALTSLSVVEDYDDQDGYYLFFNKAKDNSSEQKLIFFMHGLGAINPAIYGKWIKHLVKQGSVVIYPRYQKALFNPLPGKFDHTISQGIHKALIKAKKIKGLNIDPDQVYYFGHSYGGAAVLYFGVEYELYDLPKPKAIFACQPGTGLFTALVLEDYGRMDADIELVVLSSEYDDVVGHGMASTAFESSAATKKIWIEQVGGTLDDKEYKADHRSPYALDEELDNRFYNVTYKRAKRTATHDEEDTQGYFKISDEILANPSQRKWLFKKDVTDLPINHWTGPDNFTAFKVYYDLASP